MARLGEATSEPRLKEKRKTFASNTVQMAQTGGQSHNSKHKGTEPTQHRYSTSAAKSAGTGGRAKKGTGNQK